MSFQSIVHGRIISGSLIDKNKKYIDSLNENQTFPWITKEMFLVQDRFCFNNPIIVFGATYKQVEDDWTSWIIKFENILDNLDFLTAKVELDTEITGIHHFFWMNKKCNYGNHNDEYYRKEGLKISKNWYYGYGVRDMWGMPEDNSYFESERFMKDVYKMEHPYLISQENIELADELKSYIGINNKAYFYELPDYFIQKQSVLFPLLTKLAVENKIIFQTDQPGNNPSNSKFGPYIIFKQAD